MRRAAVTMVLAYVAAVAAVMTLVLPMVALADCCTCSTSGPTICLTDSALPSCNGNGCGAVQTGAACTGTEGGAGVWVPGLCVATMKPVLRTPAPAVSNQN